MQGRVQASQGDVCTSDCVFRLLPEFPAAASVVRPVGWQPRSCVLPLAFSNLPHFLASPPAAHLPMVAQVKPLSVA